MRGLRTIHPLKGEAEFRWRGDEGSRVEALSDMVFAFALTLLVVSSAPPATFGELTVQLWGFPGFAMAFAILLLIWHSHYIFFRRFGLDGGWVMTANAGLLFLILFLVYPLKYLATMLSSFLQSLAAGAPKAPLSLEEAQAALALYSAGYAAVFLMFAALYGLALGAAERLELTPQELAATRYSFWQQVIHVGTGGAAALLAVLLPAKFAPFAGFTYFLIGPLIAYAGRAFKAPPAEAPAG